LGDLVGFDAEMFDDDLLHPIGSLAHWKLPPFLLCRSPSDALKALQEHAPWPPRSHHLAEAYAQSQSDVRRARDGTLDLRFVDRLFKSEAGPGQMVAVSAAAFGHGADGQHLLPPGRRRLVGGLFQRAAAAAGLFHPRADARMADAKRRAFL